MKCQICKEEQAEWAWQPFGPAQTPDSYTLLGSHYRGFPTIKVGSSCKNAFQTGDFVVRFGYKGHHYVGENHQVREIEADLWEGEHFGASNEVPNFPAIAIMRDTPTHGIDVAALVYEDNSDLLPTFLAAPELLAACEEVDRLRNQIGFFLERGLEAGRVDKDYYHQIMLALAKVHLAVEKAEQKS